MNANDCAAMIQGKWKKNTEYTLRMKPAVHGEGKPGEGERGGGGGGQFQSSYFSEKNGSAQTGRRNFLFIFKHIWGLEPTTDCSSRGLKVRV